MGAEPVSTNQEKTVESGWTYETAFSRNLGIVTLDEQETLRRSRVAIAGMGGVGGIDAVTLARLGVGRFTIADPDKFEPANTNRQFGATFSKMGQPKARVMADVVRDINPEADVRVIEEPIGPDNVEEFLRDAQVFVDGIEVFEIEARRLLFRNAAARGMYSVTAGPVGFSAIWITFGPHGMSFDRYFDLHDDMDTTDKLVAFAIGVTPKAIQRSYMDLGKLDLRQRRGPSSSAACHIAAGAMACEVIKILTQRGRLNVAPHYYQFDPYMMKYAHGYLLGGNRHPWQRLKRVVLKRALKRHLSS